MNADLSLYKRQLISRFDLRCSDLLPPVVVVQVVTVHRSSSSKLTLRHEWWRARGLPAVPSGLVFSDHSHPAPHAIFLPLSLCCQTCGLYQWDGWDVHRSVWTIKKRVGGFTQTVQVTQRWMHSSHTFIHLHCFLWPKQLVFVVKRLIRKNTLLCWCS